MQYQPNYASSSSNDRYQNLSEANVSLNAHEMGAQIGKLCFQARKHMVGFVESTIEYKCWDCGVKTLFDVVRSELVSPLYSGLVV